jgi:phosphoserine phosphatase RsbU/P
MSRRDDAPLRDRALEALRANPTFASLGPDALAGIARGGRLVRLAAGVPLFRQGEPGRSAYLVLAGRLAVEVEDGTGPDGDPDGGTGRVTVAVIPEGRLVGEIAAFAAMPRTATVSARADSVLLRIDRDTIRGLLQANPDAAMAIIGELGGRLQSLNGSIAALTRATTALAEGAFRPEMLDALRDQASRFSHFAGVFEAMARELSAKHSLAQEMRTAAEIQRSFLPAAPAGPAPGRCDVAAVMRPAKSVGGDFYDHFPAGAGHVGIAVGDVSGKGVPAAIFMSVARTVLRTVAREGGTAGEVLTRMNAVLAEDNSEAMFVTVAYGRLDLATGTLDYAAAGHEEGFVLRGAAVERLAPSGPAVGLFPGAVWDSRRIALAPGDTVVLATDGITEAFDPEGLPFGFARLEALLAARAAAAPAALIAALEAELAAFVRGCPQSDDITCLALRLTG